MDGPCLKACQTIQVYSDKSKCLGKLDPAQVRMRRFPDSVESGCSDGGYLDGTRRTDGGSSTGYCDEKGMHGFEFSGPNCSGDTEREMFLSNDECVERQGKFYRGFCSFDGRPCSTDT
mmetsp:Transcript_65453/g.77477  ORF Transcript_65453/g.77477 Transcript_65453/m.77477 type:complete len:118 (-) Transcript_65453:85-438(-)